MGIYQLILAGALVAEVFILSIALGTVKELKLAYRDVVRNGEQAPFTPFERQVSEKFNIFYFGAASKCSSGIPRSSPSIVVRYVTNLL